MELLRVDSMPKARAKILEAMADKPLSLETVPLARALGRVLGADLHSPEDIPGFDRSTVDGYAVRAADTAGAGESIPAFLTRAGRVEMGERASLTLVAGQCAYVPTGGMLPAGADAMVMVEYCEGFGEDGIAVYEPVSVGRNVVRRGDDACAGDLLLRRGTRLRAQELGVLAAAGLVEVSVYRPLTVAVISTGDELISPEQTPLPGQVRDVNTPALAALAETAGYRVAATYVVRDEEELLTEAVRGAMEAHDIVVISGGSSQGEKDATARVIGSLASSGVLTHGLAVKPGKPTITGYDRPAQTLLIGLPGHPVSAMMVFQLLLGWLWRELTGDARAYTVQAVLERNVPGSPGKTTLQLVALREEGERYLALPIWGKSGLITRMAQADGYVVIDRNTEGLAQGQTVRVHLI